MASSSISATVPFIIVPSFNFELAIDSASNGMSAGPIQIDSGFTVTVNGEWSIV